MQFLCLTNAVLFTTIAFCATQRTIFNAIESLFTLNVSSGDSYPFCAWPTNITVDECDNNISLLCVIHGCFHGPSIIVGNLTFVPGNTDLTTSCAQGPYSDTDGTWVVHLTLKISDVARSWNSNESIPMYCATANNQSEVAHLSILTNCSTTSSTSSTIIHTPTPSSSIHMAISPTPTLAPLVSSTATPTLVISVSPTPSNSAYHVETLSSIFTLIIGFVPLLFVIVF